MKKLRRIVALCFTGLLSITGWSQDYADVKINAIKAQGDVYMLTGAGGNIGLLSSPKGLILVDDQFAPLAEKIESAMQGLSVQPLKYVINTHYHGDHSGGNSYFSHKAPIFAHENVRKRIKQRVGDDTASLPVVTYNNGVTIHLAEETVRLTHLPSGHTDGDTIVFFERANVLHTGDLFFQGRFPYVDLKAGGSVKGYLANVKFMIDNFSENVVIIPGHGQLTNRQELIIFAEMIESSIALVEQAIARGLNKDQIIKQGVGEKYKPYSWRFISEERWLSTLYEDLSN